MYRFFLRSVLLIILLSSGPGCSRIKSWFPDKEKDYQFKAEIPDLIVPDDLGHHTIRKSPTARVTQPVTTTAAVQAESAETGESEEASETATVERVGGTDGNRLRLSENMSRTWRVVGKALSRKSVEIVSRDRANGVFIVQFDPDELKVTDDSFWDEMLFMLGATGGGTELEYRVKLIEYEGFTEIFILDEKEKPLSEGKGLALLTLLQKAIEEDIDDD
ncbi:outer membrane protein assembly factor BamC [Methylicorpusculum sp.]|uniref:outer membrane protein assembly factor BamC n=1 Tax=Methylicorpusculum sp. TaxID=2713644 RepID=UPI00272F16DF|nr:outer membrane protein assembly factor BamC [Methylicorpusculum sp.]MDP2179650.1 outer membrane protein assembly factor BamC [Methylicorpusculum sp.]MDP3528925.1 outer membrane protein assembly factor BamC [Methylicorpusculum sp.]MDZ4154821.1 outer membrane protein assembly factor BamC [Methylicorpusculum sp.]